MRKNVQFLNGFQYLMYSEICRYCWYMHFCICESTSQKNKYKNVFAAAFIKIKPLSSCLRSSFQESFLRCEKPMISLNSDLKNIRQILGFAWVALYCLKMCLHITARRMERQEKRKFDIDNDINAIKCAWMVGALSTSCELLPNPLFENPFDALKRRQINGLFLTNIKALKT